MSDGEVQISCDKNEEGMDLPPNRRGAYKI